MPNLAALYAPFSLIGIADDLRVLLPQDKSDLERVTLLQRAELPTLRALAVPLLVWLQDRNWPIAAPVVGLLRQVPDALPTAIREILQGDDEIWQSNVLTELVAHWPPEMRAKLDGEIDALAARTTDEDLREALDLIAS